MIRRTKSLRQYCQDAARRSVKKDVPKGLKKVAKSRRRQLAEYFERKALFLQEHPWCGACIARKLPEVKRATECHHRRGKIGRLLNDERFWMGVDRECHEWIHAHASAARELGLLAPPGEWNVYPGE